MEQKTSSFDRVLGAWDILVIVFGAMIGWGWVVSTGTWIQDGGILTVIIGAAGILLIVASAITGSVSTLAPQAFVGEDTGTTIKAVLAVAVMTPFYFIGFDVIPQAAEEIKVPLKKIGSILILSVVCAVLFYALVIVAVGLVLTRPGDPRIGDRHGSRHGRCHGQSDELCDDGEGHHHRRHVRHHHELELLPHGRQPCALLHGGILHGTWCRSFSRSSIRSTRRRSMRSTSSRIPVPRGTRGF